VNTTILVPVKSHERAKLRMAGFLTDRERSRLAQTMLRDLSRALRLVPHPIVLITDSRQACEIAKRMAWRFFWESSQVSESASVDAASKQLAQEGVRAVLRLPADRPLIQSGDIVQLLEVPLPIRTALLVPSRDRLGTNAILRAPPDLFPSRFGCNSFVLHTQEALRALAHVEIRENPNIALDLDDACDAANFLDQPSDTETYRFLLEIGARERLVRGNVR